MFGEGQGSACSLRVGEMASAEIAIVAEKFTGVMTPGVEESGERGRITDQVSIISHCCAQGRETANMVVRQAAARTTRNMTGAQIIAIAITVLAILGGALIDNSRIGDVKEVLRAEFRAETGELRSGVKADIMQLRMGVNERFNSIDHKYFSKCQVAGWLPDRRLTRIAP
jgi:hypothetical protein